MPRKTTAKNLDLGLSMIVQLGAKRSRNHNVICILKRLIWLLGCGEASLETTFQVSKEWEDWDFIWRKSQQDSLMNWTLGGEEAKSETEIQTSA